MVPLPLAAGPSTAITSEAVGERPPSSFDAVSSAKGRALTGAYAYGKARRRTPGISARKHRFTGVKTLMVKPEWGTKRTCPKCSTRFYDLGSEDPVHCINCGTDFVPEPVLKSKQPLAFEPAAAPVKEPAPDDELAADDLAIDEDAEVSADEEVDLETGDDDLGVETATEDDEV
jgi:uncharacterized protein (TIGR02300 family)